jgi:hypothetical protein
MPDIMAVQGQFRQIKTKDLDTQQSGKFPKRAPKSPACQMHRWFRAETVPVEGEPL